jgi:hypothetical protein
MCWLLKLPACLLTRKSIPSGSMNHFSFVSHETFTARNTSKRCKYSCRIFRNLLLIDAVFDLWPVFDGSRIGPLHICIEFWNRMKTSFQTESTTNKVEEPVPVRVMIRIVEILLYLIFRSSYLDLPESQTSKLSLQNSLSFRQVWTPIVADKHWTYIQWAMVWSWYPKSLSSLQNQPM